MFQKLYQIYTIITNLEKSKNNYILSNHTKVDIFSDIIYFVINNKEKYKIVCYSLNTNLAICYEVHNMYNNYVYKTQIINNDNIIYKYINMNLIIKIKNGIKYKYINKNKNINKIFDISARDINYDYNSLIKIYQKYSIFYKYKKNKLINKIFVKNYNFYKKHKNTNIINYFYFDYKCFFNNKKYSNIYLFMI